MCRNSVLQRSKPGDRNLAIATLFVCDRCDRSTGDGGESAGRRTCATDARAPPRIVRARARGRRPWQQWRRGARIAWRMIHLFSPVDLNAEPTTATRKASLGNGSAAHAPIPVVNPARALALWANADGYKDRIAFTFLNAASNKNHKLTATNRELWTRSGGVARELRRWGAAKGDRVLLVYPPGLDFVAACSDPRLVYKTLHIIIKDSLTRSDRLPCPGSGQICLSPEGEIGVVT